MPEPNFFSPEWDLDALDPPFRLRMMRVAAHAGARELGASLYEIDPGGAVSPYHVHHGNEELLIVLAGRPSVRTPTGIRALEAGAIVAFVAGPDGAHRISNQGDEPARVIVVSTMRFPEVAEHLDTGTTLAMTAPDAGKALSTEGEIEVMTAVRQAMEAAVEPDRNPS